VKGLYKHPHAPFPYAELVTTNQRRGPDDAEYELLDTGVCDAHRIELDELTYGRRWLMCHGAASLLFTATSCSEPVAIDREV
jgi:hypothetical protein